MAKLRFISDPGHGWLEVPTADVIKAGIVVSSYSYVDTKRGLTYLEEDCDASKYLATLPPSDRGTGLWGSHFIKEVFVDNEAWIRNLPRWEE
jgi:hypothetical protein